MHVHRETEGPIATLTIDRPAKLNALDYQTIDELATSLQDLEADDAIRAVILTASGERAFSAGADITDLAASLEGGTERALREIVARGQGLTRAIENYGKPLVVAVNGLAYGAGCEITEAAPLAIASEHATFAKPEITLGFPPPFGGSQRLPRHVGRKRALEMILTGEPIDAWYAERIGLINRVVPHHQLLPEARALAERIVRHAPTAVLACLRAVTRGINVPIDEGLGAEASWFAATAPTSGVKDGIDAFLNRKANAKSRS